MNDDAAECKRASFNQVQRRQTLCAGATYLNEISDQRLVVPLIRGYACSIDSICCKLNAVYTIYTDGSASDTLALGQVLVPDQL